MKSTALTGRIFGAMSAKIPEPILEETTKGIFDKIPVRIPDEIVE